MEAFQFFMSVLQSIYEGGLEKFQEDGGRLSIVTSETPEVLIYHPNLPIIIKNQMGAVCTQLGMKAVYVTSLNTMPNMETVDLDDVNNRLEALRKKLEIPSIMIHNDELQLSVRVRGTISESTASTFADGINELLPNIIRIYVLYTGGCVRREYQAKEPAITRSMVMLEAPQRTTVINDDDILNVRIALENANTVEELLAQL